ncbi:MAG: DUF615 domain-containing protein [Gammaproteobacteria bacterium]|nr:DUF615 domain-containing protein [Gammaproteobacteria bacterium]
MSSDPEQFDTDEYQSKSEQKREIQEITRIGERLLQIPVHTLEQYPLSETSLKAILDGKKISSPIGRKRQIKYIGKLLRKEDIEAINQKLQLLDHEKIVANKKFHALENWRDRLIEEGDPALAELMQQAEHLDRQHLRQLIRNAQNEFKRNKPPKSKRLIFQYLKEQLES